MAINEQGYLRPTYDELLEAKIALAQELFGQDIDTSDASFLGKIIRLAVDYEAQAYETNEIIYYSRFPHTAMGQSLDRLMPFGAISRNPGTPAEHEVEFTGTEGFEIPVGFLVGTKGEEEFYLVNPVVLDDNGKGKGIVICTQPGEIGNVKLGAISEIVNPNVDVSGVVHIKVEKLGNPTETDAELRDRFDIAILGSGSGTAAAIRGAVMRINGVSGCRVVENDTHQVDAEGRPPHSFEVYVYASDTLDQTVAEAIFSKKPVGVQTVGDISMEVEDVSGDIKTVKFSRVEETVIHINLTVAVDGDFELSGEEQIKTALVDHINKLTTGQDVIFTSLYRQLFAVPGVKDVPALALSTDGKTYLSQNVALDASHIAKASAANINVEVTAYVD